MSARQQGLNELNTLGTFGNQAQLAGAGLYNQAVSQNFGQGVTANQLQNQAIAQNFGQGVTADQLYNSAVGQNFNQALAAGQFGNTGIQQNFGNALAAQQAQNAAQGQGFNQQLQSGQFGNQALNQMNANQLANLGFNNALNQQGFANQLAGTQMNNAALAQGFGNQLQNANLTNAANQQAYNQAMTNYNLPLNTLSALRTGAQVQNPSFINAPQQATTSGADILGASQMGYNAQMGDFNAKQAAQANLNQGIFQLGGAAMMSDIRTKENIKQVYWLPNGLPVYEFEYKAEFKDHPLAGHGKFVGVMAQEVEMVQPEAVITNADGYKMVNYGVLNA
jgi:hypothetical protein